MGVSKQSEQIILVTGATGRQGGAVYRHLQKKGFKLRALVRDPNSNPARRLMGYGEEVFQGSLDDPDSLMRAMDGVYGVFSVQLYTANEVQQGVAAVEAAKRQGVSHFVYSSVGSAGEETSIPHFESKVKVEDHLRSSGLQYTILRPVFFMENWQRGFGESIRSGQLQQPLSPTANLQMIAVDDIGAFAVLAFEHPGKWKNRTFSLAGDELSMQQIADAFSRATARDVKYVQVSWDQFEKNMGPELTVMYHWFEEKGFTSTLKRCGANIRVSAQAAAPASQTAATQPSTPASPTDIVGIWQGTLHMPKTDQHPQVDLRLVVKISKADAGALKAVGYSIDQGGQSIPVATVNFQDGVLKFAITVVDRRYEGKMSEDGKSIAGTWMEGTTPIPLVLERATPDRAWAIPEPPKPMAADADPTLEVATIKPSQPGRPGKLFTFQGAQFKTFNTNMNDLIALAYGLHSKQIIDAPPWFGTDLFDIDGKPDVPGRPNMKQMAILVQKLLAERCALKFHHEQRPLSVYAIRLASGGPKMTVSTSGANDPSGFGLRGLGDLVVRNMTIATFATWMQSGVMDKPVIDETELKDRYDFNLKWTPDESQFAQFRGTNGPITPPAGDNPNAPPGLYTAVQEQLGLRIESTKAPDDVIVIDHVEHPSPN